MNRRRFMGAALVCTLTNARAERIARLHRVVILVRGTLRPDCGTRDNLGWHRHGLQLGRDLEVQCVALENREHDLPWLEHKAAEALSLKPDLVMTWGNEQAAAVARLTSSVPIVFAGGVEPVGWGTVAGTLARPGANVTGAGVPYVELGFKRLELARELLPRGRRIALFANFSHMQRRDPHFPIDLEAAAKGLGLELIRANVGDHGRLNEAFEKMAASGAEAFLVYGELNFQPDRGPVLQQLQVRHRLPAIWDGPFPGRGVVNLGPDWNEQFGRAAEIAARILRGEKPAGIPVDLAHRFLLTVNATIARQIGMQVPRSILLRADKIIE